MSIEMIGSLVYLYFLISTIALMRWVGDIFDNAQKKRKNDKEKRTQ